MNNLPILKGITFRWVKTGIYGVKGFIYNKDGIEDGSPIIVVGPQSFDFENGTITFKISDVETIYKIEPLDEEKAYET